MVTKKSQASRHRHGCARTCSTAGTTGDREGAHSCPCTASPSARRYYGISRPTTGPPARFHAPSWLLPNRTPRQLKGGARMGTVYSRKRSPYLRSSTTNTVDRYEKAPERRTKPLHDECCVRARAMSSAASRSIRRSAGSRFKKPRRTCSTPTRRTERRRTSMRSVASTNILLRSLGASACRRSRPATSVRTSRNASLIRSLLTRRAG